MYVCMYVCMYIYIYIYIYIYGRSASGREVRSRLLGAVPECGALLLAAG